MRAYDALVIGGGPAGSTSALLLARMGWSVALLERKEFPRRKVCGEYLSATNGPLLEQLGVAHEFRGRAGPPVTRVGLFAGLTILEASLPRVANEFGRALRREHLDLMLLDAARTAGAEVHQPAEVIDIHREGDRHRVETECGDFEARVVIAAHGSWDSGMLPTQPARRSARPDDLLGFKAHFEGSDLPPGLMPLLAFPGGYGGMAHCDEGRVSISCCVRRDWVARIRGTAASAGEAVGAHIEESCLGARQALRGARRDGSWLAVGPIRPGIRVRAEGGIFRVGNAAGEAHPVVAEGISMAMQSAWILARELSWWRSDGKKPEFLHDVGRRYAAQWRRNFAPRLRAASFIAHWAMRRGAVSAVMPLLRRFPRLLTIGARISGKATRVIRN